jgi:outer membrane protein assembly factor BamB
LTRHNARSFLSLSAALALAVLFSCKNHPPDVPDVPAGPEYCFEDAVYTFSAIATDPDDDSVAVRFDWDDSTMSDWSGWFASGRAIELTHAWADTGTYEVRAWAQDLKQRTSGVSDALVVRVALHRPPDKPAEPLGPDSGGADSTYAFTSVASHPDGFGVAIRFAWGGGDTSDWSAFVASGESVTMSHAWSAPDTYAVTAQARDTGNALSQWSSPHGIVIRPDTLEWRCAAGGAITSSPAIGADGMIYFGAYDRHIYAVNAMGVMRWRYETGARVWVSPAVAADGTVYLGSDDGYVYALSPDGTLEWSYQVGLYVAESPAIGLGGTVYVGSADNDLYALSADGVLMWRYPTQWGVACSPTVATDGIVYVGSNDGFVHAVNADGTPRWQFQVNGWPASAAVAADGTIYVGSRDSSLYAIHPDGTLAWRYSAPHQLRTGTAIGADGTIYVGSEDGCLYAVNGDGTLCWRYQTGGSIWSTPAVAADGTIYVGSDDDHIHAVSPDGALLWKYMTGGDVTSSPAIVADGTIYVGSFDGYLYALWSPAPLADSPWPKFQHDLKNTGRAGGGR